MAHLKKSFWALDTMFIAYHVLKGAHLKAKE